MGNCVQYNKEKDLNCQPNPITSDKLLTILKLIERCICLIKCPKEGHGTGFFCRIPYPDYFHFMPVLITNYHILKENDLAIGKKIKFTLNNNTINKEILINNQRKIFSNENFDITIIELDLKKDSIEPNSFLDIDTNIFSENPNEEFKNKDIYIIGNIKEFTHGKIKNIDINGITIQHLCSTKEGMSGSPIINLNNDRIIGIHKGSHPDHNWNLGTFLREPIKQYYAKPFKFQFLYGPSDNIIENNNKRIANLPAAISLEIMKILIEKMERQICRVEYNFEYGKVYDTGFFCNIQYNHNMTLKVLIISRGNNTSVGNKIKFSINDDKIKYEILLDNYRRIYTSEEYGISIIEIKPNDNLIGTSFFEINNSIFKSPKENFKNEKIFLLHYGRGEMLYSDGTIKNIEENNEIIYDCDSDLGSGVGPIINSKNFQVIGIHKGRIKVSDQALGKFIKEPIEQFYKKFNLVNNNISTNINNKIKNNKKDVYKKFNGIFRISRALSLKVMKSLMAKMKRQICKIECSEGGFGTGFFCFIQYDYNLTMKVLMTSNYILGENDISIGKEISFSINDDKKQYKILIDKSRKIYTNKEYDFTIIEIKDKDELKEITFFDIDNNIFKENYNYYKKENIISLHYANTIMQYSGGFIKDIIENNILYICDISASSTGGPIINQNNLQVIGIHKREKYKINDINFNLGTFLKDPLQKFDEKYGLQ